MTATTMDVFALRDAVIGDYQAFIQGFLHIRDDRIRAAVQASLDEGVLWPEPWLSLNPKFTVGGTIDALAEDGQLHAAPISGSSTVSRAYRAG